METGFDGIDLIILGLALLELGLKDTLICILCLILWKL